jgi:FkbH-like protein
MPGMAEARPNGFETPGAASEDAGDSGEPLVRSRYLVTVPARPGLHLCSHAVFGDRRLLDDDSLALIDLFATPRSPALAIAEGLRRGVWDEWLARWPPPAGDGPAQALRRFAADLAGHGFLVPASLDEQAAVERRVTERYGRSAERAWGVDAIADAYAPVLPLHLPEGPSAGFEDEASFLLLGWCLTQAAAPLLREAAARRGIRVHVEVAFHDDLELIDRLRPDATVLQIGHRLLLAPILDAFTELEPADLEARLELAEVEIDRVVDTAAGHAGERLLVVQGIASPQVSPLGVLDARHPTGFAGAVQRLDRRARAAAARWPNALFLDEDGLAAREGKRRLLDDLVAPSSHHGARPAAGAAAQEPTPLQGLLAEACVDLWEVWRGRGAIRCVAVDLDGTLWPGEIADEDFRFDSETLTVPLMYGHFGGLHQALKALQQRGILLAVVSRNDRATVLDRWRPGDVPLAFGATTADTRHYLRPDDFAALEIGWENKSESLRRLAGTLGVALDQMAFIDDHPVEREEVRQRLPQVLVLGDDLDGLRELLLTSPRFQVLHAGREARERTTTTRARLARDEAARRTGGDHGSFLASLEVRCRVRRETSEERLGRIAELLRRTNQLHTGGPRPNEAGLRALLARPDADLWTLEVEDRFAAYGLVGAAVVECATVATLAVSCRVLGLEVETVLLWRAVASAGRRSPVVTVSFFASDRNLPARRLFAHPGFSPLAAGGGFAIDLRSTPLPADPGHCTVEE